MNLQNAQQALQQLFLGGAFQFDDDIATVPYEEYKAIITSIEPAEEYSIGYDLGGVNWLENCHLDRDMNDHVEMIRRERTWLFGNLRAFQLELTTVPKLIMVTAHDERDEPTILSTTWFVKQNGHVSAYIQQLNGTTIEDLRS